jgi:hypothetical protein
MRSRARRGEDIAHSLTESGENVLAHLFVAFHEDGSLPGAAQHFHSQSRGMNDSNQRSTRQYYDNHAGKFATPPGRSGDWW